MFDCWKEWSVTRSRHYLGRIWLKRLHSSNASQRITAYWPHYTWHLWVIYSDNRSQTGAGVMTQSTRGAYGKKREKQLLLSLEVMVYLLVFSKWQKDEFVDKVAFGIPENNSVCRERKHGWGKWVDRSENSINSGGFMVSQLWILLKVYNK